MFLIPRCFFPKDTSDFEEDEPGVRPLTLQLVNDLLNLLSQSRQAYEIWISYLITLYCNMMLPSTGGPW